MANDLQQKVSELVDGELEAPNREQLYKDLKQNQEMQHLFGRYCLISDALKKSLPNDPGHSLFSRVSQALESEPALLVPSAHDKPKLQNPAVEPAPVGTVNTIWPKYGMAAAAALVAVVGVMNINSGQIETPASPALVAKQTPTPALVTNDSSSILVTSTTSSQVSPLQIMPDDAQWERLPKQGIELEKYLLEHSESSSENSIHRGMIPYARVVSFGENGQQK